MFNCVVCNKTFTRADALSRHGKIHNNNVIRYSCTVCPKTFSRNSDLRRHSKIHGFNIKIPNNNVAGPSNAVVVPLNDISNGPPVTGSSNAVVVPNVAPMDANTETNKRVNDELSGDEICINALDNYEDDICANAMNDFERRERSGAKKRLRLETINTEGFVFYCSAFNGLCKTFYKQNLKNTFDYTTFLQECKSELETTLKNELINGPIKYNLMLESTYKLPNNEICVDRAFKTCSQNLNLTDDIGELLEENFLKLLLEEEEYMGKGSGYTLNNIDGLLLHVYRYTPLGGSSYLPLPPNQGRIQSRARGHGPGAQFLEFQEGRKFQYYLCNIFQLNQEKYLCSLYYVPI